MCCKHALLCARYGSKRRWSVHRSYRAIRALFFVCNMTTTLLCLGPVMPPSGQWTIVCVCRLKLLMLVPSENHNLVEHSFSAILAFFCNRTIFAIVHKLCSTSHANICPFNKLEFGSVKYLTNNL